MRLLIRYYGLLTDITSYENEVVELDEQATVEDLNSRLESCFPDFAQHSIVYFARGKKIEGEENLTSAMEIDCMPSKPEFVSSKKLLSANEIETLVSVFTDMGVNKIRLTDNRCMTAIGG